MPTSRSQVPRVSVLMPMKNAARYVRDAITSVLVQDFGSLELIVIDDGSTDGSREIVEALRDPRVRLLAGPRRGVSAAWNEAFERSSGDIVMQCDADDLYPPGRVASQIRLLDRFSNVGAVCSGFATIDRRGALVAELGQERSGPEDITEELLAGETRTHLCTFATRRPYLVAIGGKRDYFESAEDVDLQLRIAEVCRVRYEPASWYRYRLHDGSLTHTQASTRRIFFEQYARDLRAQRARGEPDDLQRGQPRSPPSEATPPDRSGPQLRGMLLGDAWRKHARGEKLAALATGVRALASAPTDASIWRSVAALVVKPAGVRER